MSSASHRRARDARGPILLVASSGGHLLQLSAFRNTFAAHRTLWVTFRGPDSASLLEGEDVVYAYAPTNRNVPNLVRNLVLALRLIAHQRPAAVISTGAGVAVPFLYAARVFGIRTIFVESMSRVHSLSLSGRLVKPIASEFYVQWPELANRVAGVKYAGSLL